FDITLNDVHLNNRTGPDYDPNPSGADATLVSKLRITDYANTTPGALCAPTTSCPGTVTDSEFPIPVTCVPTADPTLGSSCTGASSADAVVPGSILEYRAMHMETFRVRVNDAGA